MKETLTRICELQPAYSSSNTPEMQERGRLVRQILAQEIRELEDYLSEALGHFGDDFYVDASDGIGNKTQLPWVRFCSKRMSPSATEGFYVVLHFSTDGSGVNIVIGCSSSKFFNGYSIILPPDELDSRAQWMRSVVRDAFTTLEPFTDMNDFGATSKLPKSFERASALVKKVPIGEIDDAKVSSLLVEAARRLQSIYVAQREGRDLTPADQVELDLLRAARPRSRVASSQGYGLTAAERRAVELRAMTLAEKWLRDQGYKPKDTSANRPYDFEATRDGQIMFVEVKGTTSESADAIAMTHGEVALHHEEKGRTALILVTGIRLDNNSSGPVAAAGKLEALVAWDIESWELKPTAFRVSRKN